MIKLILCKVKSTDSNMHGQRWMFANLKEKTLIHKKGGLAFQWLGNDICMQNVIKIYYVVKSYENFHELLMDERAKYQHFSIHPTACVSKLHMKEIFAKTTLAASITNTLFEFYSDGIKGWQNLLHGVHPGDGPPYNTLVKVIQLHFRRRWRRLLWLLRLVLCLLLLFHNFLSGRSANASECCSPVQYTIQWQFHSRPFFAPCKTWTRFQY